MIGQILADLATYEMLRRCFAQRNGGDRALRMLQLMRATLARHGAAVVVH